MLPSSRPPATPAAVAVLAALAPLARPTVAAPQDRPVPETIRTDLAGCRALAVRNAEGIPRPTPAAMLDPSWTEIGPFGGDVDDVADSPTAPGVVLAGIAPASGAGGTLYRSSDGGTSWSEVPSLAGTSVHDIEFAADGTAWLGTLDGVWVSTDDGQSFTQRPLGIGVNDQVFEITLVPSQPARVWAGVADALGSNVQNVLRSDDGGLSWTNVTPPAVAGQTCRAIAVDPTAPGRVFAAFGPAFGGGSVWFSPDAGATWFDRSAGLPANPMRDLVHTGTRVLVCGGLQFGSQSVGLWESTDEGLSWTAVHDGTWPSLFVNDIEIAPGNPLELWVATATGGAFRSDDGGASWSFGVGGTGSLSLNEVHVSAAQPGLVYLGASSNAVWRSTDGGATFGPSSVGIGRLNVVSIDANPNAPNELAVAFQGLNDGGVYTSLDAGQTWTLEPLPGTRFNDVAFAPDGTLYAISDGPTTIAPEGVYRRTGGGWTSIGPDQGPLFESELFALRFSRNDPNLILTGGGDFGVAGFEPTVWRSADQGVTWTKTWEGPDANERVSDIEIVEDGTDQVVLASYSDLGTVQDGGVLRSTDGGQSWALANTGLPAGVQGQRLAASDLAPSSFLLADDDLGAGGLWRSDDAGLSWTPAFSGERVSGVVLAPRSDRRVYTAHPAGAKARISDDAGATLAAFDAGLGSAGFVRDLAIDAFGRRLLLATASGAFVRGLDLWVPYCDGAANSVGPGARIAAAGSTSVSANDLVLSCTQLPPGQNGIFYYGPGQIRAPFGNGLRCVGAAGVGVFRLPVLQSDAAGTVTFALDLGAGPPAGAIAPGDAWNFQFWYRDPTQPPSGFNLSDALHALFVP